MMDYAQKLKKCTDYVEALEVERRKIQVFQRELPLCLELVSQAIDACRQQLSECSEQTSSHGPVLEEFIPIKKIESCSSEDTADGNGGEEEEEESGEISDWLRSVQLWNHSPDPVPIYEVNKKGGAFRLSRKEKMVVTDQELEDKPASSSTVKNGKEESGQTQRKPRRCWSPELHKRFVHSLQQLGGPHVATPKQIKEMMKVDGLTNDEVKSHLQKYRLHMRRPSSTMATKGNTEGPQILVLGGILVPHPECPSATAATMTSSVEHGEANNMKQQDRIPSNRVYAPVATVGTPFCQPASNIHNKSQKARSRSHGEDDGSHSTHVEDQGRSSSPTSSSSTHTTAIAAAFPGSS